MLPGKHVVQQGAITPLKSSLAAHKMGSTQPWNGRIIYDGFVDNISHLRVSWWQTHGRFKVRGKIIASPPVVEPKV